MANGKIKAYKVVVPITTYVEWVECAESEKDAVENVEREIKKRVERGWCPKELIGNRRVGKPYIQKEL